MSISEMPVRVYYVLWVLIAVLYACNLALDVMDVDAAQYASMAAEMKSSGSYLQVFHRGVDYLDKPPLLFWLSSASFSVFGVGNVAYKLPALLALLLGLWSTYRFALLYDNRETALIATTVLATTQAYFLMTNDVRTDGLLTGFVMFSVYQCAAYLNNHKSLNLILAGVGVGLALLTKGPIGALIPAIAIGMDRLLKGQWRDLMKLQWLAVILVALILLAPMCYGLYTQFDLHPEKSVYGLTGPSGLTFFFWTQSFGRITGDIYWDNNAPWYYFLLTFMWDFMPWVLVFFAGFAYAMRRWWRERTRYTEYFTAGGFIVVICLLSMSRYKLPHYIFPLFPFAAILTARYLYSGMRRLGRVLLGMQLLLMHAFYGAMIFVFVKCFSPDGLVLPLIIGIGYIGLWIVLKIFPSTVHRIFLTGTITAVFFNLFMSLHFYPHLMQYQSGAHAGRVIHEDRIQNDRAYFMYGLTSNTLDFYSGRWVPEVHKPELAQVPSHSWIFTTGSGYQDILSEKSGQYRIIGEFDDYHISTLKMNFVLKETRSDQLVKRYLIEKL